MARRGDRPAAKKVLGAREGPGDKGRSQGNQPVSVLANLPQLVPHHPCGLGGWAAGALVGCSDSAKGKEVTTFSLGLQT